MTICRTLYLPDNINTLHWYKFATHVSSFTVAIHLLIWPFAMSSEKQWKLNMTKSLSGHFERAKIRFHYFPLMTDCIGKLRGWPMSNGFWWQGNHQSQMQENKTKCDGNSMARQLAMSYRMIRVGFVFDLYLIHDKVPQKVSSFNKFSHPSLLQKPGCM